MSLFSKKTTFILGSVVGSVVGLLFAKESGKTLRGKLKGGKDPQEKFEALFREYLKVGKAALSEIRESDLAKEIQKGGKEIIEELKTKMENEGGEAVKFAHRKANEILKEVEKKAKKEGKKVMKKAKSEVKKVSKKVKQATPKKVKKVVGKATKVAKKVVKKKPTKKKK